MPDNIVAANWKMNGGAALVDDWCGLVGRATQGLQSAIVLFPPTLLLAKALSALQGLRICAGVQNVHWQAEGAFTGEVSAEMSVAAGAGWAIVGHSERRALFAEDDALVARKTSACLRAGLRPIVCVGESLQSRQSGAAEQVVGRQLDGLLQGVGGDALSDLVIAYEPVWAIGTGETATPQVAQDMHGHIRSWAAAHGAADVSVLYGGSVNEDNAADLLAMPDINGALVGGASLDGGRFAAICQAAG